MRTAVLVDGAFFLKRYSALRGEQPPQTVVDDLHRMCKDHVRYRSRFKTKKTDKSEQSHKHAERPPKRLLYRIFFYDCPPLSKKAHNPISNRAIDFSKTDEFVFRSAIHSALRKKRKTALRLGYLADRHAHWAIRPDVTKRLFKNQVSFEDIQDSDVYYNVRQKQVDMKIGLDVAALAYKGLVDQIVLVAGDSDFVPAAKLARREGIDFILDPMWQGIRDDLNEHIDGLRSVISRPRSPQNA